MTQLFNRWLPALTFAAWGVVTLLFGSNSTYLADTFALYAQIAGVVLLICAVVLACSRPDAACCAEAACGHGLSRSLSGRISTFAIIALPLALMPFGTEQALADLQKANKKEREFKHVSQEMVQDRMNRVRAAQVPAAQPAVVALPGNVSPPPPLPLPEKGQPGTAGVDPNAQPPAPAGTPATPKPAATAPPDSMEQYFNKSPDGNIIAEVLDLLYAAQDAVLLRDFQGKRVETIVQYMADSSQKPGAPLRFKGVRMFMQCCTADARPIATLVEVGALPKVPEMSWVKVTGTATFPIEHGQRISVLKAEKVELTEPPADTMLQ